MANLKPGAKRPFFIDSNIWIAWFYKNDINHQVAKKLIQNLPTDVPLLTNNLVIYEVLTVLSMRAGKVKAIKFGKWIFPLISQGFIGEVFIDDALEHKTLTLFRQVRQKDLSFTDCASVITAYDYGAHYILTFDQHFKVFEKDFGLDIWNL